MAKSYFKQEHDLEKRRAEAARIREKYPDRIPVIVEKAERSDIPNIDKKKDLFQVSCPGRPDSRTICICHSEKDQTQCGEGHFHLCGQCTPTNRSNHVRYI
ncbi:hypothetical protein SAY86_011496 [Trapa natans]|uniref:Autophagy-related protein n=1 Tax=Trapa natans TaxID=22666 RepID=A0AAN7LGI8_TRANT|nr:hypothetical protein SAY86_011496 [Trapa natans]